MPPISSAWLNAEFEAARDAFLAGIKHPELYDFSQMVTMKDVYDTANDIQKAQAKTKSFRALSRIRPFLDALNQFSGTVEVFVQVKPDILALLWGPVKFLIQISSAVGSAFDKVAQVLADVGHALPLFQEYHSIFQQNDALKAILSKFYVAVLDVYKILVNFMHDRRWKTFLESLWPGIRTKLSVVQDSIKSYKMHLTDHATLEHIRQSYEGRNRAMQEYEENQGYRDRREFEAACREFSPELYTRKLQNVLDQSSVESGSWLETHADYVKWLKAGDKSCQLLWLQGIPGSGKTFLSANIIQRLQKILPGKVFSIFLSNENQSFGRLPEVFHSILFQAASRNKTIEHVLLGEVRCDSNRLRDDISHLKELTMDVLKSVGHHFLVIDGLDEIEESARKALLTVLLELLDGTNCTKLLLSSRAERDIEKLLHDKSTPISVHSNNQDDIRSYTESKGRESVAEMKGNGADDDMVSAFYDGVQDIISNSQGMFLYAKLVLNLLAEQGTAVDIRNELKSLPDGLDQAYGRILSRIDTKISRTQRTVARKVLQWLVCALRPLREEEMLQILVIEPGAIGFPKGRRYNADIKAVCGPIIEMVDGTVRFVHFSAKEYLTDERVGFLQLESARLDAAVTCSSYLCHHSLDVLFDPCSAPAEVQQHILSKDYVFFDYSASMWLRHISLVGNSAGVKERGLDDVLSMLLKARDANSTKRPSSSNAMLVKFESFGHLCELQKRLAYSYRIQEQVRIGQFVEDDNDADSIGLRLFKALQSFRSNIEVLYCTDNTHHNRCGCPEPLRTYGPPLFFCEQPFCTRYNAGLPTRSLRKDHLKTHQRNFNCPQPGCIYSEHGFHTQGSLRNHEKTAHPQGPLASSPMHIKTSSTLNSVSVDVGDLASAFEEAIIHSDLDTVQTLLGTRPYLVQLLNGKFSVNFESVFDYCLCLAAWKSSKEVLQFILDQSSREFKDRRIRDALTVAIETKNLPNIKFLLSFNPDLLESATIPRPFWDQVKNKRRNRSSYQVHCEGAIATALSLWDPSLMDFLVRECDVVIPWQVAIGEALFRFPAICGLGIENLRDLFEKMRKYINVTEAVSSGMRKAVDSRMLVPLQLCLEIDNDSNFVRSDHKDILSRLLPGRKSVELEMMYLLLKKGASPVPQRWSGVRVTRGTYEAFQRRWDVSWDEFAGRVRLGEDLETIVPKWHKA